MELGNAIFGNSRGEYEVDRSWQNAFVNKLYDMGFNGYGFPEYDVEAYKGEFKIVKSKYDENDCMEYFENDTFILMPYYWGDDDYISQLPNFVHKPTGFELQWYKYPLRDSYMNKNISFDELMEIMEDCKRSLGINDIPYHYKKAAEYIEKAMDVLYCADNEQKTIDIYNELKKIKGKLQTKSKYGG